MTNPNFVLTADGLSDNPKPDSHAIPGSLNKAEVAGGATKFPLTNGHSSVYTENRATSQSQDQIDERNELPPTGIVARLIRQTKERSFDKHNMMKRAQSMPLL